MSLFKVCFKLNDSRKPMDIVTFENHYGFFARPDWVVKCLEAYVQMSTEMNSKLVKSQKPKTRAIHKGY